MKKNWIYIILCGLFLFHSCASPQSTQLPKPSITSTALKTTTTTAPTMPMVTSTPLPSVTPTHDPVISTCIEFQSALPEDHLFEGMLLLENPEFSQFEHLSLYDLKNGEIFLFPSKYDDAYAVSPNHTRLAINTYDLSSIDIFSSNGSLLKRIFTSSIDCTGRIAEWLDNDRIAVRNCGNWEEEVLEIAPDRIVVINTVTDEMFLVSSKHPGLDMGNQPLYLGYWGTVVFDPQLKYVVYPGAVLVPESDDAYLMGYILYSLLEERVVAGVPGFRLYAMPDWFVDGSQFIVAGFDDFYRVSITGEIEKITQLNSRYKTQKRYVLDDYYRLSPDEGSLAFWIASYDENLDEDQMIFTLAILNLETGEVIDTCIPTSHYFRENAFERSFPVWSPDSKNLVVSVNSGTKEDGQDLVLVDLEYMEAYQLSSNWIPTGWLLSHD
jgi:hypothetical protein